MRHFVGLREAMQGASKHASKVCGWIKYGRSLQMLTSSDNYMNMQKKLKNVE